MIERFYTDPRTLARLQAGPLGSQIDGFAAHLAELGYARATILCQLRLVADLSQWLAQRGLGVEALDERLVAQALEDSPRGAGFLVSYQAVFGKLLAYLREREQIPPAVGPEAVPGAWGRTLAQYARYLECERGLSPVTVSNYLPEVRRFLKDRFGEGPVRWGEVTPAQVTAFLVRHGERYSRARVRVMVTALRSFFRFLRWQGDLPSSLAAAVPTVAQWRLSGIPKSLEPEQVQRLLESCDRATVVGQRDYAILLLLARLGLRAGEVKSLRLEDIDWQAGELRIRGKGSRQDRLPLPQEVGEALTAYLRHRHPKTSTRRVFVRVRAPYRGLAKASSVSVIVHRALGRAGIDSSRRGAHLLRHSLACEMLRRGASMAEIAQVLRHRSAQTTEVYAKVDQAALRQLALPWPGGGGS